MSKVIALLTDFGEKDGFAGIMKGVMLNILSDAKIVDITHQIEPVNIHNAAWVLGNSYSYFPKDTVFVCVVDPGVGSSRNILLVKTKDHYFLAPDNGLLTYIIDKEKIEDAVIIDNKDYWLSTVSSTFHGRDIFAPVAAYLAGGNVELSTLGKTIDHNRIYKTFINNPKRFGNEISGIIAYIDHFGNLVTNVSTNLLFTNNIEIHYNSNIIKGLYKSYQEVEKGKLLAIVGSNGFVEIAANNDSAKAILNSSIGSEFRLICLDDS